MEKISCFFLEMSRKGRRTPEGGSRFGQVYGDKMIFVCNYFGYVWSGFENPALDDSNQRHLLLKVLKGGSHLLVAFACLSMDPLDLTRFRDAFFTHLCSWGLKTPR